MSESSKNHQKAPEAAKFVKEMREVFGSETWMQPTRIDRCPGCGTRLVQRTPEQNSKLHALLSDIAHQKQWAGHWLDVEDWKRLITAAWERASGRQSRIFPAVDGQGIDVIYQRTSRLSKQEMIELIEYAQSWAVDNGVKLAEEAA